MKTVLKNKIKTIAQANEFIKELYKNGELFHFDDSVDEIFEEESPIVLKKLCDRVNELFSFEGFDPFETAVAISYEFPLQAGNLEEGQELANSCKHHHEIICLYKKDGKFWVSNFEPENEEELIEEYLHGK